MKLIEAAFVNIITSNALSWWAHMGYYSHAYTITEEINDVTETISGYDDLRAVCYDILVGTPASILVISTTHPFLYGAE